MIRRSYIYAYFFLFLCIASLLYQTLYIRKKDHTEFSHVLQLVRPPKHMTKTIHQSRENVQKDFYYFTPNKSYHTLIQSKSSTLSIDLIDNKKIKAKEMLNTIELWQGEKGRDSIQKIRYITAKNGSYFFPEHRCITSKVHLTFFDTKLAKIPLDPLPSQIYLRAYAQDAYFELTDNGPIFRADYLQAKLPEQIGNDVKKRIFPTASH